ncbi:MAG: hypothetical protein ACC628_04790 [Pirellulaceae bacterium]
MTLGTIQKRTCPALEHAAGLHAPALGGQRPQLRRERVRVPDARSLPVAMLGYGEPDLFEDDLTPASLVASVLSMEIKSPILSQGTPPLATAHS